jgi:DNA mismatch repair protein MutS2
MDEKALRLLEYDKIIAMLAERAATGLGRETALALTPSNNPGEVRSALSETTDAQAVYWRKGTPPFGGIVDLRGAFRRVALGSVLSCAELLRMAEFLRGVRSLRQYCTNDIPEALSDNLAVTLGRQLQPNRSVEEELFRCIASEDELSDHASPELASIRRNIRVKQDGIKDRLNAILRSTELRKHLQDAVVTLRGDRYVIPVKQESRNLVPGLVHDMSASGATVFVEPLAVVEANNEIRALTIREGQEVERILAVLTELVAEGVDALEANLDIAARLDFLFAKAKLSRDLNGINPRLLDKPEFHILKGRHPLLPRDTVVPVNLSLGDAFTSLVITGPNTGGKTVTLKTAGLFVLMTQAGLHIPAEEGTQMGLFSNVFADIGDEQSIEQSLSTFSSHMRNIVHILANADAQSLILFDELGAGTDPTEGAALAMAILEGLREAGVRTMATTHYSELKIYAMTTAGVENACCEFDVETLRPTYRLLVGIPGKSNAFAISSRLGLSDEVIARARETLSQESVRFEDVLGDIERKRSQTEHDQDQARVLRAQAEALEREMREERAKLVEDRQKVMDRARQEARQVLLDARHESDLLLSRIRELEKSVQEQEREKTVREMKQQLKQKLDGLESSLAEAALPRGGYAEPPVNLKPGETVHVLSLNQRATVLDRPDGDGQVTVQAGIMKVRIHISQLKRINEQKETVEKMHTVRATGVKANPVRLELDLRGSNAGEALEKVDKYLDDAVIAGLHEVTLIHGKGTGVLRRNIHDFLRTRPHVTGYRLGKYGEGESGVTVVSLLEE